MWTVLIVLGLAANALACDKGCEEYKGVCACEAKTEIIPSVKPDNVKRPDAGTPTYLTDKVKVIEAPNMAEKDEKMDKEKAQADKEGKEAAGIK